MKKAKKNFLTKIHMILEWLWILFVFNFFFMIELDLPSTFLFTFISYSKPLLLPSTKACLCAALSKSMPFCCPQLHFVHTNRHAFAFCSIWACKCQVMGKRKVGRRSSSVIKGRKKHKLNSLPYQVYKYTLSFFPSN